MSPSGLADVDAADRVFLLRVLSLTVGASTIMAAMVAWYLTSTRGLSGTGAVLVLLMGLLVGVVFGVAALWVAGKMSRGFVAMVTGAGNLPPAPSFSYQESLVARGKYQEAAEAYQAHLAERPGDHHASLALAALLADRMNDLRGAVSVYHRIRAAAPGPAWEYRVSQALIDLYRARGQRGQLVTELARFADRERGSPAGDAARRELLAIKAELAAEPPNCPP